MRSRITPFGMTAAPSAGWGSGPNPSHEIPLEVALQDAYLPERGRMIDTWPLADRHAAEFVLASVAFALIAGCGQKKDTPAPQAKQPALKASAASALGPTVELPSFVRSSSPT